MSIRPAYLSAGASLVLAFGLSACSPAQTTAPAQPAAAPAAPGTWEDPKAPRGGAQRPAAGQADWDNDWDNNND